jgi:hypothetical protein
VFILIRRMCCSGRFILYESFLLHKAQLNHPRCARSIFEREAIRGIGGVKIILVPVSQYSYNKIYGKAD